MLTDLSSINQTVDVNNDFSFVDRLGSFIGNREYQLSFERYKNGNDDRNTFVWQALQAIGDDVGKKIYSNIRDYIDLVSNVDRCKAKNLQSMMLMYGQKFQILENIDKYPIEVQNLIDLFSISRKYILQNDFLMNDFIQDMESEGVISSRNEKTDYGTYDDGESKYDITIDGVQFNTEKYEDYIENIFRNLLSDFLELRYNDTTKTRILGTLVDDDLRGYTISSYYSLKDEAIQQFRDRYGIPVTFDEQTIVDNIDNGTDFLDNYIGFQRELLEMEIARRASTLKMTPQDGHGTKDSDNNSVELKTKYSYYRKAKVLEYYHFINNIFTQPGDLSGDGKYIFDERYFELQNNNQEILIPDSDLNYRVNEEALNFAAKCLTKIVSYITSLRERIKLQTRKNYMKGTNNLLRYLINQYLVDYAKTSYIFQKHADILSSIQERMRNHSSENVNVIEYFDETEYFNIETKNSSKALNGGTVNERFWQGEQNQNAGTFTQSEISNFYMKDLALETESTISDLIDFLDIIYNLGANTSYINKTTNQFVAQLSSGDAEVYSDVPYTQLSLVNYHYSFLTDILSDDFQYAESSVSDQISNIIDGYYYEKLSAQYLSDVSEVYDKYINRLDDISGTVDELVAEVDGFISGEYSIYLGGSASSDDVKSKIDWIKQQTSGEVHYTKLLDTITECNNNLTDDIQAYTSNINNELVKYGYVDPKNAVLGDSISYAEQFITNLIETRIGDFDSTRLSSLSSDATIAALNVILSSLTTLRELYVTHETQFSDIIQNPDFAKFIDSFAFDPKNYSLTCIQALSSFVYEKDANNSKTIGYLVNNLELQYYNDKAVADELQRDIKSELKLNIQQDMTIEQQLEFMLEELLDTVTVRTVHGMDTINSFIDGLMPHVEFISAFISSDLSSQEPLSDVVAAHTSEISYDNTPEYVQQKRFYDYYNGLCADSDIYYNYKNTAHPTKQYHPYLWNFVQSDKLMKDDSIQYNLWQIQNLNEENIQKTINRYIGEFGQSINFWCNEGMDYTGYSSRYENGNNKTQSGIKTSSKVADYDGGFFPDAVEYLQSNGVDECIRQLQALSGEFYEQYYQPNGCSNDDIQQEIERLRAFGGSIISITSPKNKKKDVLDIYKYGIDYHENAYILYKKYDEDEPSYRTKKDTPGVLWVRMADYPFAYPAFAISNGTISVDENYVAFTRAISNELCTSYDVLTGGSIYDFEFDEEKYSIALMTKNGTDGGLEEFQTAKTFVATIYTDYLTDTLQNYIRLGDNNVEFKERVELVLGQNPHADQFTAISSVTLNDIRNLNVRDVVSSRLSVVFKNQDIIDNILHGDLSIWLDSQMGEYIADSQTSTTIDFESEPYLSGYSNWAGYALLGCYPIKSDNFYVFYAKKHITASEDGTVEISLSSPTEILLVDYTQQRVVDSGGIVFANKPTIDDIAISLRDALNVSFAFVIDTLITPENGNLDNYTTNTSEGRSIVVSSENDYTKDDPIHTEMNSHDIYTSDIILKNFIIQSSQMREVNERLFNMNADMSYLPVYPGQACRFDITRTEISSDQYFPVQLMGQSRNIDGIVKLINPTPNPYFTMEDITEKYTFGRVFEDYLSSDNKTLKILNNPPINPNPTVYATDEQVPDYGKVEILSNDGQPIGYRWTIPLSNQFEHTEYTEKDYNDIKFVMYNIKNFGKNSYFMVDISSMVSAEVSAKYDLSSKQSFDVRVNDFIMMAGTYDNQDVNISENNHIYNISSITARFDYTHKKLDIDFMLESTDGFNQTFINQGQLRVCILNEYDMGIFQYYHYLDAYGVHVSSESSKLEDFPDNETDNFVIRRQNQHSDEEVIPRYYNYFLDKYGRKIYLKDIDLTKYSQLSDVEILRGEKGLQFKYDEELTFHLSDDNFYYPTVNIKYPKTMAEYVQSRGLVANMPEGINLDSIFAEGEIYIMDIPDSGSILSNMGLLNMTISSDNSNCIIVDENMYNLQERLSPYDVRALSTFVFAEMSSENISSVSVDGESIEAVLSALSLSGWELIGSEESDEIQEYQFDVSQLLKDGVDIKKFLRIYINYKKDVTNNNAIVLYFNYNNYINTPYIKVDDFKVYTDIIDDTYLKLAPGESGKLDIVVQFRYEEDDKILGCDNVKVLTYQIYNISDDKPKFLIKEVYRIGVDDYTQQAYSLMLGADHCEVMKDTESFNYLVYWETLGEVSAITFDMMYDQNVVEFIDQTDSNIVEVTKVNELVKTITVKGNPFNSVNIRLKSKDVTETAEMVIDQVKIIPMDENKPIAVGKIVNGVIAVTGE